MRSATAASDLRGRQPETAEPSSARRREALWLVEPGPNGRSCQPGEKGERDNGDESGRRVQPGEGQQRDRGDREARQSERAASRRLLALKRQLVREDRV